MVVFFSKFSNQDHKIFLCSYLICCDMIIYLDVNECEMLNGGCQHQCRNTNGSYLCQCNDGFLLNGNGRTCTGKLEKEWINFSFEWLAGKEIKRFTVKD